MEAVLETKVAQLRAMGKQQNLPMLVEVLDGLTGEINKLNKQLAIQSPDLDLVLKRAIDSLSYSELEGAKLILREMETDEGLLVASQIADRLGITRSVIVNAFRKLESAGIVESRSLGMKGTHYKIIVPQIRQVLRAS